MRSKLFRELQSINAAIKKQIPVANNRAFFASQGTYEEKERHHTNTIVHVLIRRAEYTIIQYMNECFPQWQDNDESYKQHILKKAWALCTTTAKTISYTHNAQVQKELKAYFASLSATIDDLITRQKKGLTLVFDDRALAQFFKKNDELEEYREIIASECERNAIYATLDQSLNKEERDLVNKINVLLKGIYFDKIQTDVAHCDEYSSLALVKILHAESLDFDGDDVIELVCVRYGFDNHVFIIINRDREQPFQKLEYWGKNAIIVDCWADFIGNVEDVLAHPEISDFYQVYCKWEILGTFKKRDIILVHNLTQLHQYYAISGVADIKIRAPLLMEEYQLTLLEDNQFIHSHQFLNALLQLVMPDNFRVPVKLMLTESGNEIVTVLDGFACPIIAIHKDFLTQIAPNGPHTIAMLEFGLAQALQHIKQTGISNHRLRADKQHLADIAALGKCRYGEAAIDYLQASITFASSRSERLKIPSVSLDSGETSSYEQRIKNLRALFAREFRRTGTFFPAVVPVEVSAEIVKIKPIPRFFSELEQHQGTVAKLKYLTTQLKELHKEVLPFEYSLVMSVRVKEFCSYLHHLNINFDNEEQVAAVEHLIDTAFKLRIPAFEALYLAIQLTPYESDPYHKPFLKPLGIFKRLQDAINQFISSPDEAAAIANAQVLIELFAGCNNHFVTTHPVNSAIEYLKKYRKSHNQCIPTGDERLFCSRIGIWIDWNLFPAFQNEHSIPWDHMIPWVEHDKTGSVRKALFLLGVNNDQRLWSSMSLEQLYEMSAMASIFPGYLPTSIGQLKEYPSKYVLDNLNGRRLYEKLAYWLSAAHRLDTSMFASSANFEHAFKLFYDKNQSALIIPQTSINFDNPTIQYMLQKMAEAALHGTDSDKKTVRSFFLGREDKRDLRNLYNAFDGIFQFQVSLTMEYSSPYIQFILNQHHGGVNFHLFSTDDIFNFIDAQQFATSTIPISYLIKLGNLPTPDSLEAIFSIISFLKPTALNFHIETICTTFINQNRFALFCTQANRLLGEMKELNYSAQIFLESLIWNIPECPHQVFLTPHELIRLYRTIDDYLMFPSALEHNKFNQLIKDKILSITDLEERIKSLEELLFLNKSDYTPLSHIEFCKEMIELWVNAVAKKYGRDDNSEHYSQQFIPLVKRVIAKASQRDLTAMLAKLADAVESQYGVSEVMGLAIEPEKYLNMSQNDIEIKAISALATASKLFNNKQPDQLALLNFLSTPISFATVKNFSNYIILNNKVKLLLARMQRGADSSGQFHPNDRPNLDAAVRTIYHSFWDRDLRERAVIINHVLIPATSVVSDKEIAKAYDFAFTYITQKLFPDADQSGSDDEFAKNFLHSYLEQADKYSREYLLAGLLVASNQCEQQGNTMSVGKKLSILCANLGPAYVKLAQAIHSHPNTPAHIKKDLEHLKGHANPPPRWQLWRMIIEVLPEARRQEITRVGKLLGSASYNLALLVRTNDGKESVLSLLREDAENDAKRGFKHIKNTVLAAKHPRIQAISAAAVSIIDEASALSQIEMDHQMSKQQFAQAVELYYNRVLIIDNHVINIFPAKLIQSGPGYRFIDLMQGKEFNELPYINAADKSVKQVIAKAVLFIELSNILSGSAFDSDRHGSQLRAVIHQSSIQLGLYDFGEMGEAPTEKELQQFAEVLYSIPTMSLLNLSIKNFFDIALSAKTNELAAKNQPANYLIRIRKALLALQDFQQILAAQDLINVLNRVQKASAIHPLLQTGFEQCLRFISLGNSIYSLTTSMYPFFGTPKNVDARERGMAPGIQ